MALSTSSGPQGSASWRLLRYFPPRPFGLFAFDGAQLSQLFTNTSTLLSFIVNATSSNMDYEEKQWIVVNICGTANNSQVSTAWLKKEISDVAEPLGKQQR